MQAKAIFLILATVLFVQGVVGSRQRRDTPLPPESQANPLEDFTKNVNTFIKDNLKPDKVWESISENLKSFGEKVQTGAKDLAQTIQKGSSDLFKSKPAEEKN